MKIAEALIKVKDLKGKLRELSNEVQREATFQLVDSTDVVPDITPMLETSQLVSTELASLKTRIAKTNAQHGLTDRINEMEQLRGYIHQFEQLGNYKQETKQLSRIDYDGPAVTVVTHATYDVDTFKDVLNQKRARIRELDLELQRLNWEVDLED